MGYGLSMKQQEQVITRVLEDGYKEEAEMLTMGNLWDEPFTHDLIDEMREEGEL